jgi:Fe-S cluster assembly iron-binding protein IscA
MDEITEQDGIEFLVNERDKGYFDHVKIDYVRSLLGGGQFIVLRV